MLDLTPREREISYIHLNGSRSASLAYPDLYMSGLFAECEAMAASLLDFVQLEQTHRAFSILKQIGILSLDGPEIRAVKDYLIADNQSAAKDCPDGAGAAGWT